MEPQNLLLESPAFVPGGWIPKEYTGFGRDVSPAFSVGNLSPSAVTLALVLDDLDVPFSAAFCHWLIWNLPPEATIPEALPHGETLCFPAGAVQGMAWGAHAYRGPKPPVFIRTPHRYRFTVYALDTRLSLPASADKTAFEAAVQGHILQTGTLTARFQR